MTIQELNTRQGWTLSQKIDHAVGTVEAFLSRTGKVPYVSFSGGKDSTVLLDIVRRFVDRDIKAVFCNTGNEYPEIVRFVRSTENVTIIRPGITVRKVIGKYGFPLISKEQAHGIRQAKTTKKRKTTCYSPSRNRRNARVHKWEDCRPLAVSNKTAFYDFRTMLRLS